MKNLRSGGRLIDCEKHKAKCKEPSWRRDHLDISELLSDTANARRLNEIKRSNGVPK
uniref:HNH endonuclease n=1 Tax=Globodera pallida TaxID=36090 RepID=A0A183CR66_GLOPA